MPPQSCTGTEVGKRSRSYRLHMVVGLPKALWGEVNDKLLIHDNDQRKRFREHFTAILNRLTYDEFSPLICDI